MDKHEQEFTILVNNRAYQTPAHELTGAQIKGLASVPEDYELFEVRGADTIPVSDQQTVKIHNKEEFRAIPRGTFGAL